MLKRGYGPRLSTGVIASSGTLGQIIPPSVVLVLLGSVLNVPVGDLFLAAVIPGVGLVVCYVLYIVIYAQVFPGRAPAMPKAEVSAFRERGFSGELVKSFVFPFLLILAVLGSIFAGIASPTEAAGVGAFGAILLTLSQRKLTMPVLKEVMRETTLLTSMVFMILVGATAFSLVFRGLEGDKLFLGLIERADMSSYAFLFLVMVLVFVAGFYRLHRNCFHHSACGSTSFCGHGHRPDLDWDLTGRQSADFFSYPSVWFCAFLPERRGPTRGENQPPLSGNHPFRADSDCFFDLAGDFPGDDQHVAVETVTAYLDRSNDCSTSAMMSSICSRPTDTLTRPGVMPTANLSSSESLLWVVEAGCVAMVRVSPRLADSEIISNASRNFLP